MHLPLTGQKAHKWGTSLSCDAWPVSVETYSYWAICSASPASQWY